MRVYSFGDSFTTGLGADRKWEESQLGNHPKWDTMTDKQKNKQRSIVANFWNDSCFTKHFSDKLNTYFFNHGENGCNNLEIVENIVSSSFKFKPNDIVLVGWTSSLRDKLYFWPDNPLKWVATDEIQLQHYRQTEKYLHLDYGKLDKLNWKNQNKLLDFWKDFSKKWLINSYNEEYYHIYNTQILYFTQEFLKHFKVKYIFFDAFDIMLKRKEPIIDMSKYWKGGKETIYSYIEHDEDLLESKKYVPQNQKRHPSKKGHKYFTESLYKFYKEVYDD